MSDNIELQQPTDEVEFDELATLKARADMMGIRYNPKISVDKLREKIDMKMTGIKPDSSLAGDEDVAKISSGKKDYLSEKQFQEEQLALRKANAGKLVRVRVTCMNPAKKEWDGEIISVGSAKIGTYKKFVKFNAEDGWHIPHIIYQYLKEKKCSIFQTVIDAKGQKIRKSKLVNEFSIEVLPPLTKEELKQLAIQQAMEAGKDA